MEVPKPAAGAHTGGDWRSLLDPDAREVMVKRIMKPLRQNHPHTDSEELLGTIQNIVKGFEQKFYEAATDEKSYLRKLGMLSLYLEKEKPNQNTHRQAPGLPPQGNNPGQSSAVSLISRQQTLMPNSSTYVHASSLQSLGQSLAGVDQTSAHNISGQSTIPQAQLMAMQTGSWSPIHQNPLNTVGQCQQPPQCVEGHQQHPQFYLHQQPSLQQTQLPQQLSIPLQQQLLGQQPNVCENQLSHELSSAADMQHQHRLPVQSNNLLNHNADKEQVIPTVHEMETDMIFSRNGSNIFSDEVLNALGSLEDTCSQGLMEDLDFTVDSSPHYANYETLFTGPELVIKQVGFTSVPAPASDAQMVNNDDENGWLTILTSTEDPNYFSMAGKETNLKKRKFDGSCSSSAPVLGQPTSVLVDDHFSTPARSYPEIP